MNELFPYFLKSETHNAPPLKTSEQIDTTFIVPSFHGEAGPVQDSFPPFYDNFYKAWEPTYTNLGLGPTGDPKGGIAIGAYAILLTIEPKNASRSYAGTAYYKPNAARKNLQVLTGALMTRVMFAPAKEPLIATGVSFTVDGKSYTVSASKEVILCAGAFQSPQLLELSGIGNAELLESKRIEVLYDNPNVGENLQDHVYVPLGFEAASGEATFESLRDQAVLAEAITEYTIILDRWLRGHQTPMSRLVKSWTLWAKVSNPCAEAHRLTSRFLLIYLQDRYHKVSWMPRLQAAHPINFNSLKLSSKSSSTRPRPARRKYSYLAVWLPNWSVMPVPSLPQIQQHILGITFPCSPFLNTPSPTVAFT